MIDHYMLLRRAVLPPNSSSASDDPMPEHSSSEFKFDRILNESFIEEIDYHTEIDSTNDRGLELVEQGGKKLPLLVLTDSQSKGRGRGSNQWYSTKGSLTYSLLVALEELPGERVPQVSLTVGLALCQAIESIAPRCDVAIKWPNDLFLEGRKLAGVLIELPPSQQRQAVIGVGMNVNNPLSEAPSDVVATAISLSDTLQMELDVTDVLIQCLCSLDRQLTTLHDPNHRLSDQWNAYHFLGGRQIELEVYSRKVTGKCVGIDHDGALLLETTSGLERFLGGVVTRFEPLVV